MRKRGIIAATAATLGLVGALIGAHNSNNSNDNILTQPTKPAAVHVTIPEGYVPLSSLPRHERKHQESKKEYRASTPTDETPTDGSQVLINYLSGLVDTADTKGLNRIVDLLEHNPSENPNESYNVRQLSQKIAGRYGDIITSSANAEILASEWHAYGGKVFDYVSRTQDVGPIVNGLKEKLPEIAGSYGTDRGLTHPIAGHGVSTSSVGESYERMIKIALDHTQNVNELGKKNTLDVNTLVTTLTQRHPLILDQSFRSEVDGYIHQFQQGLNSDYGTTYTDSSATMSYCTAMSTPLSILNSLDDLAVLPRGYRPVTSLREDCDRLRDESQPTM